MYFHINDRFQVTECSESLPLKKKNSPIPEKPFSIHIIDEKVKFSVLNAVSQIELSKNTSITIGATMLNNHGISEYEQLKVAIRKDGQNKEYVVIISEKSEREEYAKKYQPKEDHGKIKSLLSTNIQFERFFNRIEQVNIELDKRNQINSELISLNKQLLLKDQLLERNKNNLEALLNNNLQAFVLVDTFYSIQAFNNKAKELFQSISQKQIEKNAFFYEFFYENDLNTIKSDFKKITQSQNNQLTATRAFVDKTNQKPKTFRVNYTAILDKDNEIHSISIGLVDITDLIDTKKELEASQSLISSVFSTTSLGIMIVNENGDVVDANRSICNLLEIPILRLKDSQVFDLFDDSIIQNEFPFFLSKNSGQIINWTKKNTNTSKTFNIRGEILDNSKSNRLVVLSLTDITNELLTKQRLKNITDNIPGTVFRYLLKDTGEDKLLYVSERGENLWGFTQEELLKDNQLIWNNYHPEDIKSHKESILKSQGEMTEWNHEWRYNHPIKGLRWHRGIGKPSRINDKSVAWDSIIFDITEEKEIERESQVLKDEIDNILVQSPDIICTINTKGEFVKVSSASFEVLGYFKDELIGERFIDHVSEEYIEETLEMFEELLEGNSTSNFENHYYHKNGNTIPLIWSARWDDTNELLYCIARDGREKKKHEHALHVMNERYKLATRATNEIIWEYDVEKENLYFSDNFLKIFDFELPGYSKNLSFYNELIDSSAKKRVKRSFRLAINNISQTNWEAKYKVKKDPSNFIVVQDSAIIIRNEKGVATKMVGAIRDITALEKASQIERFEKMILSKSLQPETNLENLASSFVKELEKVIPNTFCSVLSVVDEKLSNLASPSLPEKYVNQIQEIPIGINKGSCGAAAHYNRIVVANDIENDDKWTNFKFATYEFGLKSCWSTPVQNSRGTVVATIGIYKKEIFSPSTEDKKLLKRIANLLGILIEKYQYEEKIKKSNEVYELVNKASRDAIYELDVINDHIKWGESYTNIFGYPLEKMKKFTLNDWFDNVHPEDVNSTKESWESFLNSNEIKWSHSYRYLKFNNTFSDVIENGYLIRDEKGNPVRMIGVLRDISEQKQLESLITRSSKLAKIGSWEIDLFNETVYWSPMTRQIHGVDDQFKPTFENALNDFFEDRYIEIIKNAFQDAQEKNGTIDLEAQLITQSGKRKWIRLNGETQLFKNKLSKVFGSIQDIDQQKRSEIELTEKTKFLTILSEINKELLDYENWSESILKIFKLIGESIEVDRVYFFKFFKENNTEKLKQIYEWCSDNTFPQINDPELQRLPSSAVPNVTRSMHKYETYHQVISEIPDGAEKDLFKDSDIKSIYNIPIRVKQKLFGLLGFDDCTNEREWTKQEISFLATIAQNISIAYEGYIAELKLKKEVKAREIILESIKDGFLSVDENWIINYWNEEAQVITGINKKTALGKSFWKVFPEINNLPIKEQIYKTVINKTTTLLESEFPGLKKWFELNIYPTDEGTSIYFKDITYRKEKEQELILSNQRFEKVTEATNDAIWEWNIENNTLHWGVGYEKQFGHKIESDLHNFQMWENMIHPDDLEQISSGLIEAINEPKKTSWTSEYRYKNYDDSYSYVMDRGYIIRNSRDKAIRMIGAMTDISHRKEYEESLEYLNSVLKNRADELTNMNLELERFAYIASHDLQEPLRMITGFLSQLEKKYAEQLDEKANQYIFYAVDGAKRMRKIILDLLHYSRVGKLDENEKVELDLNLLINEVKNDLGQAIKESNALVEVSNLPKVVGNKISFNQIFQNLISNAIKYRNENTLPKIIIDYEENETHFIFSISDNGIGIDTKFHDKIFVIFQRLHNKDHYSGTGVGLAIVKKVIEQLEGEIWLESNEKGGTTFYFSIPKKSK